MRLLLLPALLIVVLYPFSSASLSLVDGVPSLPSSNPRNSMTSLLSPIVTISSSSIKARWSKKWWTFHDKNLGHSDVSMSIGIPNSNADTDIAGNRSIAAIVELSEDCDSIPEVVEDENEQIVKMDEMKLALSKAQDFARLSRDDLVGQGWKIVHDGAEFQLYKKRRKLKSGAEGPVEYLMTGQFSDITPYSFLLAQISRRWRGLWDNTMKEMASDKIELIRSATGKIPIISPDVNGAIEPRNDSLPIRNQVDLGCLIPPGLSNDVLYYRTKWPWPLKDRDYTLARRCKIFHTDNAFVLVSKSTEASDVPAVDGVIRVDNYYCHSVIFSTYVDKINSNDPSAILSSSSSTNTQAALNDQKPSSILSVRTNEGISVGNGSGSDVSGSSSSTVTSLLSTLVGLSPEQQRQRRLARMLGLQRRYEERLRNRRWQAGLAYREKHHVKWELKAKMLQRRIEEISGVKTRSSLQEQFIPASNGSTSALMSSFAEASALTRQIGAELGSRSLLSDELSISEDNVGAEPVCEPGIPLMVEAEKRRPQKLLNTLNRPGLRFITIFCDDQKVPLHPKIVDILSAQGEKVVPESFNKLHEVARQMDTAAVDSALEVGAATMTV